MKFRRTAHVLCMCAIAVLLGAASIEAASAPPVVMKVLVLAGKTSEPSYQSITTYLGQIGVPYQAVALSSVAADASGSRLSKMAFSNTTTGQGLYQGIILTDSTFAACSPSCLSTADWTTLNTYAAQFSVRVASYYTLPAAQWGLLPADSGVSYSAANPLSVTLTTAGAAVFPYLNSGNAITVSGQGTAGIKVYRATTTAGANETTTPLLMAGVYTVAATHTTADGREVLALTMDNSPTLLHSLAFHYGVINWVTKGVFLGSRKLYLNPENDDVLNGNWIYAPALHPACESNDTCPRYIVSGPDLQALASWQSALQSDPQFQSFRETMTFNGVGTTWFNPSDPIFAAIKSVGSQFWWLSHTWDHPNLDCYSVNKNGACVAATLAQSLSELNRNIAIAPSLGITLDQTSMVTPFNSGLSNAQFLQAAKQIGIQYIVFPQLPTSPNVPVVNTLAQPIVEVTRMNNNLFDDSSSPDTGVYGSWPDQYNAQFGPNGATPIYSQNQTYSQILDIESQTFLQNMLSYAPYPITFHIASMYTYDGTHSLYTDLFDAITTKYKKAFTLPVLSVNLESIGALLTARASYNASGVTGVYTPGVSVVLTTSKAATIPVTGICSQGTCGTYGTQIQDNVAMAANSSVTIPLTVNVGVSLASVSVNPATVAGGTSATGTITLSGAAPAGGASVTLSSNSATATVPASAIVGAGSTTATFAVSTSAVTAAASITLTAGYSGVSKTAALTVTPAAAASLLSVAVSPASVIGGASATGTVTLSGAAPAGGVSVSLSSNNASATVPASVTIAAGSTSATFTASTSTVASSVTATLTASYNAASKTAALTVTSSTSAALSSVSLNPTSIASGASSTGTVSLSAAAPTGGVSVALTSSDSASATVPASVTVAAGSTTASFSVTANSVAGWTAVTITATYNGVGKTASLTVTPNTTVAVSSVSVSPTSVTSATSATGTVILSKAAPAGGIVVALWTTGTVAFVPVQITIAAGSTTGTFPIAINYTTSTLQDAITAYYNGASKTAGLTVTP